MNITGKMSVFPVKFKYKDGNTGKEMTGVRFETTLSHKNEDGTYSKGFTIRVEFTKECMTFEQAKAFKDDEVYQIEVKEGWLDTREYVNKEGQAKVGLVYRVNKAQTISHKKYQKKSSNTSVVDDDLPF